MYGVGLGWMVSHWGETDLHWHDDGTGGYTSFLGFIAREETGVVVLKNSGPDLWRKRHSRFSPGSLGIEILKALVR